MQRYENAQTYAERFGLQQIGGQFVGLAVLLLASWFSARAELPPCYAGFEISPACITERGLDQKVVAYQRKITEAMPRLGASYKIRLRLVNNPVEAGYDAATVGDVFTDVVRNEEMRNESFIINVTADFLEKQPEILFEASSLHEVCHVMNDDLTGYHRNGANIEAAEEYCVLQVVGEACYKEYLQAYATYQHWDTLTYEEVLQKVRDAAPVPAPSEIDEADRIAVEYFRKHADGNEHLLVYNGELHDETLYSTRDRVQHDPEKLKAVIKAGKPMMLFSQPPLGVEFRVIQLGNESTIVSYGFKGTAVEDIKNVALEYRNAVALKADVAQIEMRQNLLDYHLAQDSFNGYLQYVCPVEPFPQGWGMQNASSILHLAER